MLSSFSDNSVTLSGRLLLLISIAIQQFHCLRFFQTFTDTQNVIDDEVQEMF